MTERKVATLQILASGFCFGFLGVWGKWAFSLGIEPGEFLAIRFSIASLILLAYLFLKNRKSDLPFPWVSPFHLVLCILLGVFGYAVFSSCYFIALKNLSASMAVLLLYLYPVMVAIGARVFLKEHLGRQGIIAIPLATIGLVLLVWGDFSIQSSTGLIAGVTSAVVYAAYILVSRKHLPDVDAVVSTFWMQFGTGFSLMLLNFRSFERIESVVKTAWLPILGIATVSTIFSMALFLQGLKKLKSAEASILNTIEPVTALTVASIVLGESLALIQIAGGFLVIFSMILIALRPPLKGRLK